MGNERLLLIDSDPSVRQVTLSLLNGYQVCTADSGEAADRRLGEEPFDLVLVNLPQREREHFVSAFRERRRDIPFLLFVLPREMEQGAEFLKSGIYRILLKPFSRQEILNTVEDSLKMSRIVNENVRLKLLLPLFEMTQNLSERPDPSELFRKIECLVSRETGADLISLSIQEKGAGSTLFREIRSPAPANGRKGEELIRCLEEHFSDLSRPLNLRASDGEQALAGRCLGQSGFSSVMISPLNSKYNSSGTLICGKSAAKGEFYSRDFELFSIIGHQLSVLLENYGLLEELENAHFESLKALASAIEAKDAYTSGHCDRLVDYAQMIADRLNLNPEERKQLRYGAALHDIGKIGIKDAILGKQGKLTESEYEEMKLHPGIGADMLKNIKFLRPVAPIIYHHQECYDGSGYPEGIAGEKIPKASRIVAILDTFDAMTTDRPYRKALPVQTAVNELLRYSGKQFDPELVGIFIDLISKSALDSGQL